MKYGSFKILVCVVSMSLPTILYGLRPGQFATINNLISDLDKSKVAPGQIWPRMKAIGIKEKTDFNDPKFIQVNRLAVRELTKAGVNLPAGTNVATLSSNPVSSGMQAETKSDMQQQAMPVSEEPKPSSLERSNLSAAQVNKIALLKQDIRYDRATPGDIWNRLKNIGITSDQYQDPAVVEINRQALNFLADAGYELGDGVNVFSLGTNPVSAKNPVSSGMKDELIPIADKETTVEDLKALIPDLLIQKPALKPELQPIVDQDMTAKQIKLIIDETPALKKDLREALVAAEAQSEKLKGATKNLSELNAQIRQVQTMTDKDVKNDRAKQFLNLINAAGISKKSMSESNLTAGTPFGISFAREIHEQVYASLIKNWKKWGITEVELSYILNKYIDLQLKALDFIFTQAAGTPTGLDELRKLEELKSFVRLGTPVYDYLNFGKGKLEKVFEQIKEVKTHIIPGAVFLNATLIASTVKTFDGSLAALLHISEEGWFYPDNGLIEAAQNGKIYRIQEFATEWSSDKFMKMLDIFDQYATVANTKLKFNNVEDAFGYVCLTFDKYLGLLYLAAEPEGEITKRSIVDYCRINWSDKAKADVFIDKLNGGIFKENIAVFVKMFGKYMNPTMLSSYNQGSFVVQKSVKDRIGGGSGSLYKEYTVRGKLKYKLTDTHKKDYDTLVYTVISAMEPIK